MLPPPGSKATAESTTRDRLDSNAVFTRDPSSSILTHPGDVATEAFFPGLATEGGGGASSRDRAPSGGSEREVRMKRVDRGYCCRGLVCLGALVVILGGGLACALGAVSSFAGPSAWLPGVLSEERAATASLGSLVAGGVVALIGLVGCLGACRQSKLCLFLFCLVDLLLLAAAAASVAVVLQTQAALGAWSGAGYATANLTEADAQTLATLHAEFGVLYAVCAPLPNVTAPLVRALDRGDVPHAPAVPFCEAPAMQPFGLWVADKCLGAEGATSPAPSRAAIARCRADLAAAPAVSSSTSAAASWLFCMCGASLDTTISSEWTSDALLALFVLLGFLFALFCFVCGACRSAGKAKKRRKAHKLELLQLKAAEEDAANATSSAGGIELETTYE